MSYDNGLLYCRCFVFFGKGSCVWQDRLTGEWHNLINYYAAFDSFWFLSSELSILIYDSLTLSPSAFWNYDSVQLSCITNWSPVNSPPGVNRVKKECVSFKVGYSKQEPNKTGWSIMLLQYNFLVRQFLCIL